MTTNASLTKPHLGGIGAIVATVAVVAGFTTDVSGADRLLTVGVAAVVAGLAATLALLVLGRGE